MTAVKLIGAAAMVAFAYLAGDRALDGLRRRICLLSELVSFAKQAAVGIGEYKLTLAAIEAEADVPTLSEIGFFKWLGCGSIDADALACLSDGEREAVSSFVSSFGKCFSDEQVGLCRALENAAASSLERAKSDYETKSKIYKSVPPLAVMSLLIVLL